MRRVLNNIFPFDAIARWWYILIACSLIALTLSLTTDFKPIGEESVSIQFAEGPPSSIETAAVWVYPERNWKTAFLVTTLGFLVACSVIWLLEEVHTYKRDTRRL